MLSHNGYGPGPGAWAQFPPLWGHLFLGPGHLGPGPGPVPISFMAEHMRIRDNQYAIHITSYLACYTQYFYYMFQKLEKSKAINEIANSHMDFNAMTVTNPTQYIIFYL